jgi:CBS domain containing-hemolysin-like protein
MFHYLIYALALAGSVTAVAFFEGSEIAFVSSNRFRIRGMAKRGWRGAATAQKLLEHPDILLSATLVGTNLFVVLAASLATNLLSQRLGAYSVPVSTVAVTAVVLVFGEVIPKAIGRANPEIFFARAATGLSLAYYVLYPLAKATSSIAWLLLRASGSARRQAAVTKDEIKALVKEAAQAGFGLTSPTYAYRVLDLSGIKVASVMIPMDAVTAIDEESGVREVLEVASQSGHSRYPIYKGSPDNIVGVLHVRDLLGAPPGSKVKVFARSGYFVPETKTV